MSGQSEEPLDKLPVHSDDAERGVLGCILLDSRKCMGESVERLQSGFKVFYDVRHQTIYRAMLELYDEQKEVDVLTLAEKLKSVGVTEEAGGMDYVMGLPDAAPSASNLPYYAEIVQEKFLLRRIAVACGDVLERIKTNQGTPSDLLQHVESCFLELGKDEQSQREKNAREFTAAAIDRIEDYHRGKAQMRGISTGFDYLDKMTCGMEPNQLIVYAARPGMGKTSLAMNILERVAIDKKLPVGVFSLEMTADELGSRLLFQVARCDYQRFRTGFLENGDIPKLTVAAPKLQLAPIWIDDSASLNVLQLRAKARRMMAQYGVKLFVIDYLQLLVPTRFFQNREQEVAEISGGLKSLAKELRVPIIVLAQLNRDFEKEPNRKPRLSDLRESGRIEADADMVGMLYEPKLKAEQFQALNERDPDWSKKFKRINLLIAKQRNGPTGDCEMEFFKASMRFESHHRPNARTYTQQTTETTETTDEEL